MAEEGADFMNGGPASQRPHYRPREHLCHYVSSETGAQLEQSVPEGPEESSGRGPLNEQRADELATRVLEVYDYARAQVLLSRVNGSHQNGPYRVSALSPLSTSPTADADIRPHLWQDLTAAAPELAWDWMRSSAIGRPSSGPGRRSLSSASGLTCATW